MGFSYACEEVVTQIASRIQGITVEIGGDTTKLSKALESVNEYSCAVTPQIRQTGNRLSGNAGTAYASLLA